MEIGSTMTDASDDPAARVLDAAAGILGRQGLEALTVRAVAAAAGTTTMTVYTRFGGKNGLLAALARQGFALLAAEQARAMGEADPAVRLIRMCRSYRALALAHPGHYRLMTAAGGASAAGEEAMAAFLRLVEAAGAVAGMRRAERLARALHAFCHGLVMLEMTGGLAPGHDAARVLDDGLRWLIAGAFSDGPGPADARA
jgi:AcrR family transcriptional regulator